MIIRKISREERAERRLRLENAVGELNSGSVPVPSEEQIFVGDGPYLKIASEFLRYFVDAGGLRPHDTVLDIGCGIGRMAYGLTRYLDEATGKYVGFDPVFEGVEWCNKIFAEYSNFSFLWADIYNELYNPAGRVRAADYVFPCEDSSVDLVVATSIFTHLYESDIRAYLLQSARVLKPQGRLFATAFLHDGDRPASSTARISFDRQADDMKSRWHLNTTTPLSGVCFADSYFRGLVMGTIGREPLVRKGLWQGGPGPWFQDLIIV